MDRIDELLDQIKSAVADKFVEESKRLGTHSDAELSESIDTAYVKDYKIEIAIPIRHFGSTATMTVTLEKKKNAD